MATYRLQLSPAFGFAQASACVPYLKRLGITHLYLSPITEARPGSLHGYDVVDHNTVRAELGGALQLQLLLGAVRQNKLKVILDIVPNHAGVGPQNTRFEDVLTYGPHSPYARYFDIDWQPLKPELHQRVLLPFLANNYGDVLAAGEIDIRLASGRLYAAYRNGRFALQPATYGPVLQAMLPHAALKDSERKAVAALALQLQGWQVPDHARGEELIKGLHGLLSDAQFAAAWKPLPAAVLHTLLETQYWRLCNWRNSGEEINYRRFFNANDLIGLRVEEPRVFTATHRLVKEMICDPVVEGLRIDHVDGLNDPQMYLERLRTLGAKHVWVEKVLAPGEILPEAWPVDGTTGYEFGADVAALLVHPGGRRPLSRLYRRYVREGLSFAEEAHRSKRLVMSTELAAELQRLAHALDRMSETDFRTRDYTLQVLRDAIMEVIAALPRPRTYLPHAAQEAGRVIHQAVQGAIRRNPASDPGAYRFIGKMLHSAAHNSQALAWVTRFQQYSAPVAAQGVDKTAALRYHRLLALNDVGCDLAGFGMPARSFHHRAQARHRRQPNNLLATQTHVHKFGEDLRTRLAVLSELPEAWGACLRALHATSKPYRTRKGPGRQDMYCFFQHLVAQWDPNDATLPERLCRHLMHVARCAKRYTSWTHPNAAYESALRGFVLGTAADSQVAEAIGPLAAQVARFGMCNSISQLVLKCTTPGVPDFFSGAEQLQLGVGDSEVATQVDFAACDRALSELADLLTAPTPAALEQLLDRAPGAAKMYLTARLLRLRQTHPDLATEAYHPLEVQGPRRGHVLAFRRGDWLVAVPRFFASLQKLGGWGATQVRLPPAWKSGRFRDGLTGASVSCPSGSGSGSGSGSSLLMRELPLPWAVLRWER